MIYERYHPYTRKHRTSTVRYQSAHRQRTMMGIWMATSRTFLKLQVPCDLRRCPISNRRQAFVTASHRCMLAECMIFGVTVAVPIIGQ